MLKRYSFLTRAAGWLGIVYLGLAASCVVYLLQFFLLRTVGSVRQVSVDYCVPVVSIVEGVCAVARKMFGHSWRVQVLSFFTTGVGSVQATFFSKLAVWF